MTFIDLTKKVINLPKVMAIFAIRLYQVYFSGLLGPRCRFYPSCSQYAIECFERVLWPRAIILVLYRIVRCMPFHPGGIDYPPKGKC